MHGGNIERIGREYGINPERLIDFSTGINPLGFPRHVRSIIDRNLSQTAVYPDPGYKSFKEALAKEYGIPHSLPGNGSSELLFALLRALCPPLVIVAMPSYIDYTRYSRRLNIPVRGIRLKKENGFILDPDDLFPVLDSSPPGSMMIAGNPNNPTGRLLPSGIILDSATKYPQHFFCIDEAYLGFTTQGKNFSATSKDPGNILRLRSLTKLFSIPGIRIGYLCGESEILTRINQELPDWNVGTLPIQLAQSLAGDQTHGQLTRKWLQKAGPAFYDELAQFPQLTAYPTDCNFLLLQVRDMEPRLFYESMLNQNIVLRSCENFDGLEPGFFRTSIRLKRDNEQFIEALKKVFKVKRNRQRAGPVRTLMFQGTSSHAGKSLMTAAFCRALINRGISVAPFKAQNMSLNSCVTPEGGEIGRAQVLQARAARIEPHVLMNPVLLKPTGDTGSQVVVMGKPESTLSAMAYHQRKKELKGIVRQAFSTLAAQYDAIVLEGAGSPGEINLREHDIVNMSMAGYADSPVILVGDIDRGGVYASFVGHLGVMAEWERHLVQGFLVNKFRGDITLLDEANKYMADRTGKPVIGVMPWVHNHNLPEEDSVDFNLRYSSPNKDRKGILIGFIDLPHLSNSTDLDPFQDIPGVSLVRIDTRDKLVHHQPDGVIIPGSKNVIADFQCLQESGIIDVLLQSIRTGRTVVMGICGGFQMLGNSISDPHGIEGPAGSRISGMGLINLETVLEKEKTLRLTTTRFCHDSSPVKGYEIHHGRSTYRNEEELFEKPSLGCRRKNVWGTYLHGVFDNDGVRERFLSEIHSNSGVPRSSSGRTRKNLEAALDEFTAVFEQNVDIAHLMKLMNL